MTNSADCGAGPARDWTLSTLPTAECRALLSSLDRLAGAHRIAWHWVRGHAGHPENERADELANRGVEELSS